MVVILFICIYVHWYFQICLMVVDILKSEKTAFDRKPFTLLDLESSRLNLKLIS